MGQFQVESRAGELIQIYDRANKMADDDSNVPAYAYGNDEVAGAGKTSSGLSMLMNAAGRGMKDARANMDKAEVGIIKRFFVWNMLYNDDPNIKGDAEVVSRSTMGLLLRELQQVRIAEFMDRMLNPTFTEIVPKHYYIEVMREYAELLQMDTDKVLPTTEEIKKLVQENIERAQQQEAAEAEERQKRQNIEDAKAVADIEAKRGAVIVPNQQQEEQVPTEFMQ
jgi:hypothetical protein